MGLTDFFEDVKDKLDDIELGGWVGKVVDKLKDAGETATEVIADKVGLGDYYDLLSKALAIAEAFGEKYGLSGVKIGPIPLKLFVAAAVIGVDQAEEQEAVEPILTDVAKYAGMLQEFIDEAKALD